MSEVERIRQCRRALMLIWGATVKAAPGEALLAAMADLDRAADRLAPWAERDGAKGNDDE